MYPIFWKVLRKNCTEKKIPEMPSKCPMCPEPLHASLHDIKLRKYARLMQIITFFFLKVPK